MDAYHTTLTQGEEVMSATMTSRRAELTENAMTILQKRYLDGETVDQLFDRVSGGNPRYRRLLSELKFLPNSPTLFNAGRNNGCTLSACFVFDIEDSLDGKGGILDTRAKAALVAKAGGGCGYYGGKLRPRGSAIKTTKRGACGPVAVLRDLHSLSKLIFQGGKRALAQMFVLPVDHADIREFIHCKDEDPKSLESFNISLGWTDDYVRRVFKSDPLAGEPGRLTDALPTQLWWEQCESAWLTGCPGMWFPDTVNRSNPNMHLGLINAPNPCGETPNRSDEPCNLGSLVLGRYFKANNRTIDWDALGDDVIVATQFLDDILDRNVFPHPDITAAALLTRKLGLGVMGWADLLAMLHIQYDSEDALALASRLSKFINEAAHKASEDLATLRGPYAGYDADKTQATMRRNETNTSVAPTGTIGIIAGVKGFSIEPWYAEEDERITNEGIKLLERVPDWIRDNLDGFVPKCAHEIGWEWHVRHQAAWQQNVDLGVSKTINMPNDATVLDVSSAYKMMYDLKCKGGTIYRDDCRDEQVLRARDDAKHSVYSLPPVGNGAFPAPPSVNAAAHSAQSAVLHLQQWAQEGSGQRRCLPDECRAVRRKFRIGQTKGYLHVGLYDDGTPGEIFLRVDCQGSTIDGLLDSWCKDFSISLQLGWPLEKLVKLHRRARFEPCGPTGVPEIPVCTSIPDFVVRWMKWRFLDGAPAPTPLPSIVGNKSERDAGRSGEQEDLSGSGMFCPDCGTMAIYQAGCLLCPATGCGWSRCN